MTGRPRRWAGWLAVAVAAGAVAAPGGAAAPAAAPATAPVPVPLTGDFDGDGHADLYWPVPGARAEVLMFGGGDAGFATELVPLRGTFRPVVGDFDGDGADDVFHYAPGAAADPVWYGGADRGLTNVPARVDGSYHPLVADFDGDGRDDVFWYAAGPAADHLWHGTAARSFRAAPVPADVAATPAVGDFDGDGRADIRWHADGRGTDVVWYAAAGGFEPVAVPGPERGHRPVVADFDGEGSADLLWYRVAGGPSFVELGSRLRTTRRADLALPGGGTATTGDLDGDGAADVLVAGGETAVAYGSVAGLLTVHPLAAPGGSPVALTMPGPGAEPVYWARAGQDVLWRGSPLRSFGALPVTTRPNRVPALDPAVWDAEYDTYGYVAHAMGGVEGRGYTNSLEAFRANYAAGYRVFEVDFLTLADGTILAQHDGTERWLGLRKPYKEATYDDVRGRRLFGRYTVLTGADVVALLRRHRDVYVVVDPKWSRVEITRRLLRAAADDPQVARRLLPHIAGQTDLDEIRRYYPLQHYVLALYRTQVYGIFDDPAVLAFVRRNRTPAVMMWIKRRDRTRSLAWNGREGRRYEPAFADQVRAAGAVAYVHSTSKPEVMREFAGRRIGVYSDGPRGPGGPLGLPVPDPLLDPLLPSDAV